MLVLPSLAINKGTIPEIIGADDEDGGVVTGEDMIVVIFQDTIIRKAKGSCIIHIQPLARILLNAQQK